MAINKKLIHVETLESFQSQKGIGTSSLTQTEGNDGLVGQIPYRAIVFIKDKQLIWTHGKYYNCSTATPDVSESLNSGLSTCNLNSSWTNVLKLDGLNSKNLTTGSYVILIIRTEAPDTDYYTGYFSFLENSGNADEEIILNRATSSSTFKRIYAKIATSSSSTWLLLAFASGENGENGLNLQIKIKKLL